MTTLQGTWIIGELAFIGTLLTVIVYRMITKP